MMARGLEGWSVVVTRAEGPNGPLGGRLAAKGARVILLPSVRVDRPDDPAALVEACGRLEDFDYVVFTSPRAVEAVHGLVGDRGLPCEVAVVGPKTAELVRSLGWVVRIEGPGDGAAALARTMVDAGLPDGARVLFPASNLAGSELPEALESAGVRVERVEAYTTRPVAPPIDHASDLALADAVTFTSPSAVEGWRRGVGKDLRGPLPEKTHFVAIGPTTSARLGEYGITARTPDESTFEALVARLCALRQESRP